MKKSLLVCIAFNYSTKRLEYIKQIISVFLADYDFNLKIIIDTNISNFNEFNIFKNIQVVSHLKLDHPFHLTWQHRKHIKENIDDYDYFMYIEDDIILPYENFLNYIEKFKDLWPIYVPSFIRIEELDGQKYIVDAIKRQPLNITNIAAKQFTKLESPYHGFWIMPQKELKETLIENFVRVHQSRETAASYPMWELQKIPLVEIENEQISKKCYAYHISNTYILDSSTPYSKIRPQNLFI